MKESLKINCYVIMAFRSIGKMYNRQSHLYNSVQQIFVSTKVSVWRPFSWMQK